MKMPWEKQKQQPEPPKRRWICADIASDEKQWVEDICAAEDVYYEMKGPEGGLFRFFFREEDEGKVQEILSRPKEKPEPKMTSLEDRIGRVRTRMQIPDDLPARAAADTEKEPSVPAQLQTLAAEHTGPPIAIEKRWAEEKLSEELASSQERAPEGTDEKKQRRKRKSSGRTNQIMTRLTDSELTQFQRRVKKSGLAQGEYLRSAALTGKIVIEEHSMADVALLDELAMIRAELGRQGGLLKMTIRPNEGQRELAPEEWAELIGAIRRLERTRNELSELEVKISNGHHNS